MLSPFVLKHPLGVDDQEGQDLLNEMLGQNPCQFQIKHLLFKAKEPNADLLHLAESSQRLFIDVVVQALFKLFHEVIVSLDGDLVAFGFWKMVEDPLADGFGLGGFGQEGENLLDDVGDDVSVLVLATLLHLLLFRDRLLLLADERRLPIP